MKNRPVGRPASTSSRANVLVPPLAACAGHDRRAARKRADASSTAAPVAACSCSRTPSAAKPSASPITKRASSTACRTRYSTARRPRGPSHGRREARTRSRNTLVISTSSGYLGALLPASERLDLRKSMSRGCVHANRSNAHAARLRLIGGRSAPRLRAPRPAQELVVQRGEAAGERVPGVASADLLIGVLGALPPRRLVVHGLHEGIG